ncbi:MAG: alkaline phosphatase family protein [Planctomycetota bacterium]|jgi:predicted AlkP superfamily phosphohydrolase/phosphomutase
MSIHLVEAYIGPGAGIALVGSFLAVGSALLAALTTAITWPIRMIWWTIRGRRALAHARTRRVVILGLDGLEPTLVEQMLEDGRLPHLARLREQGSYCRLGTTWPPISPVAWSSFSTGTNPGKHAIYDFVARDPANYRPAMSSVRIRPPRRRARLGRYRIPLSGARIDALRRSRSFWSILGDAGIFSAILRVPITFPPERFRGVQLSAMCVPDLRGTNGTFLHFTDDATPLPEGHDETSGDRVVVQRDGDTVRSALPGPRNPLRGDAAGTSQPFVVRRRDDGTALLTLDGQTVRLTPGVFTDWVPLRFALAPGLAAVSGQCRFRLLRFDDRFDLYCTPIQIDPLRPAMPIAHPPRYARYLGLRQGRYATLGLAEDTGALSQGVLSEEAFLEQAWDIHDEREQMFFDALSRVRRGLVTCVFDAPDRVQHMFWRFLDDSHPANGHDGAKRHDHVVPRLYERMDDLVGRTMDALDEDAVLFVMSDHGFKPFRRAVDLNAWLRQEGYLALRDGASTPSRPFLADVDWSRTRAYALGLAGVYVNQQGREGAGTVPPDEAPALRRELAERLGALRDPATGEGAVHEAVPREQLYRGPYVDEAPDVIVGYAVGYRVSWQSAQGRCGDAVFADNSRPWSGDHCIHPDLVPGVLFSNRPLATDDANIVDLAATTLDLFGVPCPDHVDGRSLLP